MQQKEFLKLITIHRLIYLLLLMVYHLRWTLARCIFGYYDGKKLELIEGKLDGKISLTPSGENGYGWDKLFIPNGYDIIRAEMNKEDNYKTYLLSKPIDKVRDFLLYINKI